MQQLKVKTTNYSSGAAGIIEKFFFANVRSCFLKIVIQIGQVSFSCVEKQGDDLYFCFFCILYQRFLKGTSPHPKGLFQNDFLTSI